MATYDLTANGIKRQHNTRESFHAALDALLQQASEPRPIEIDGPVEEKDFFKQITDYLEKHKLVAEITTQSDPKALDYLINITGFGLAGGAVGAASGAVSSIVSQVGLSQSAALTAAYLKGGFAAAHAYALAQGITVAAFIPAVGWVLAGAAIGLIVAGSYGAARTRWGLTLKFHGSGPKNTRIVLKLEPMKN